MEQTLRLQEMVAQFESQLAEHRSAVDALVARVLRLGAEIPDLCFDGSRWVSGSAERMSDASLEIVRAACEHRHDDPAAVYARPRCNTMGEWIAFDRDYLVATLAPGAIHLEPGWALAMRADGLPERVIRACARRLEELA